MQRYGHGAQTKAGADALNLHAKGAKNAGPLMAPAEGGGLALHPHGFGFIFEALREDPANLLPTGPETVAALKRLGAVMDDTVAEA